VKVYLFVVMGYIFLQRIILQIFVLCAINVVNIYYLLFSVCEPIH